MKFFSLLCGVALMAFVMPAEAQMSGVLKPGDAIQIQLQTPAEDAQTVTASYPVSDRGTVKVPHLEQEVPAAGVNVHTLARRIEAAYKAAEIYTNPTVVVSLPGDAMPNHVVTVGGEVRGSGEFPLRQGMTLMAAINRAGGFTEFAKTKQVKLIRGNTQTVYDMRKISPDGSNNPVLRDGDQIIVPAG